MSTTLSKSRFGAVAALALALLVAGCSGSSNSATPPASTTSSSSAAAGGPADAAAAKAQVTANWEKFFNYRTPTAQAAALLQDGSSMGPALTLAKKERDQTKIKQAAKVTAVTFTSATQATVTYNLLNGTTPLLPNATGVAVLVNGTWMVSKLTFCTLVTLGNNGKAPAGC